MLGLEEAFVDRDIRKLLHTQTISDVLTGFQVKLAEIVQERRKKHLGQTFGDYAKVKADEEFEGYRQIDRGYLVQFQNLSEAKFLTANSIF